MALGKDQTMALIYSNEAYFLRRTKGNQVEHLMDLFRIDREGQWKNPMELEGLSLPLIFNTESDAYYRLLDEQKKDPSWEYEICNFNR